MARIRFFGFERNQHGGDSLDKLNDNKKIKVKLKIPNGIKVL